MTSASEFQAKVDKSVTNMDRLDAIVNGGNTTVVPTDGGDVPSLAKMMADSGYTAGDRDAAEAAAIAAAASEVAATSKAALSQAWAEGTLPGGVGTKSAKEWSQDAEVTLSEVNDAGATQVAAVNASGTTQTSNVTNAASAVQATASSYFNALSTGEYDILSETVGPNLVANLTSNIGVIQRGFINGSDITTGDVITALRTLWAAGATTATTEIKVYKRNVAGATGAGTLNNAAPIATHDTLVATFSTTPTALGITAGTSNPTQTADYALPIPITVEAGYDYMFQMKNLDGSSAVVNMGATYALVSSAVAQRRAGFYANTATPTTFINEVTTRPISFTLLKNKQKTQLPATDTKLRTLIDNSALQTLTEMNARNAANLHVNAVLFPITLATPASFWGDSLTADGDPVAGAKVTDVVDTMTVGTVNMYGITGQTSTQITTRISAASAGDKAGFNRVMQGTNDLQVTSPATVIGNYATAAAAFTNANYLMSSPWMNSSAAANLNGRFIGDVRADLRSAYGAKFLDSSAMWARYGASASDQLVARRGGVPTDLTVDGLHKSSAGGLIHGQTHALALIAQAGGAPFVHDDIFGFKSGDASGAAIGTPRVLGTGYNFRPLAGNEDGAVQVNRATGAITRTDKAILQPYRELFIEAENTKGHGRNGRIILVQQMDGTLPTKAVRVRGNGASVLMPRYDAAPAAGPEMTVVAVLRHGQFRPSGSGGANIITSSSNASIMGQANWQTSFNFRDSAGAILGSRTLDPESPSKFNFYAFAIKTDTGLLKARANLDTPTSGTPSAGNIDPSKFAYFFSNGGDTLPWIGDIMMLAVYPAYHDITNDSVLGTWWDNANRLPKDIGAFGNAGGTLSNPLFYLYGMAGNYILGQNAGSVGNLHAQVPISASDVGFVDVT